MESNSGSKPQPSSQKQSEGGKSVPSGLSINQGNPSSGGGGHVQQRKHHPNSSELHRQPREIKPQMVQMIERLLERQAIEYYEKNVVNQMLEFMHYYVTELLQEAKIFKDYAGKKQLDVNDVKLAISSKAYNSFTRPLPLSVIKQIALEKNSQPLPKIEDIPSIASGSGASAHAHVSSHRAVEKLSQVLPPNEYCQINPNVQVYSEEIAKKLEEKIMSQQRRQQQQFDEQESKQALLAAKAQQLPRQIAYPVHKQATNKSIIQFDTSSFLNASQSTATAPGGQSSLNQISLLPDDSQSQHYQYEQIQRKPNSFMDTSGYSAGVYDNNQAYQHPNYHLQQNKQHQNNMIDDLNFEDEGDQEMGGIGGNNTGINNVSADMINNQAIKNGSSQHRVQDQNMIEDEDEDDDDEEEDEDEAMFRNQ